MPVSAFLFLLLYLCSCQSPQQEQADETNTDVAAAEHTSPADTIAQKERRPAPEFHRIPTEMASDRVYVCDDANADVFHTEYGCELLKTCQTVKKNVTLIRAVEDYGRYNCEICSKDMASIFDEQRVINQ